jgi:hypothetical protein
MIALSGCAKRNADRELARVLALIDRHVERFESASRKVPRPADFDELCRVLGTLTAIKIELEAHIHRTT